MLIGRGDVQVRIADGGFIIQWMEPRVQEPLAKPPAHSEEDEKPAYLQDEEKRFGPRGFRPMYYQNLHRVESKVAVRTDLAAALELVGQILERLAKRDKESPGH